MSNPSDPTLKWADDWLKWFDTCKQEERSAVEFDFMLFDMLRMRRYIYLKKFSESVRNDENILFLEEGEHFKINYDKMGTEAQRKYFEKVYDRFFKNKNTKTLPKTINIDGTIKTELDKVFDSLSKADTTTKVRRDVFDDALNVICRAFQTDVYPRFLGSNDFKSWRQIGLKTIIHKFFQAVTTETPNSDSSLFTFLTWLSSSGIISSDLRECARRDFFTEIIDAKDKELPVDNKEIEKLPIGTVICMADILNTTANPKVEEEKGSDKVPRFQCDIFAVLVVVPGRDDPSKKDLVGSSLPHYIFSFVKKFEKVFRTKADSGFDYTRLPAADLTPRNIIQQNRGGSVKAFYINNVLEIANRINRRYLPYMKK